MKWTLIIFFIEFVTYIYKYIYWDYLFTRYNYSLFCYQNLIALLPNKIILIEIPSKTNVTLKYSWPNSAVSSHWAARKLVLLFRQNVLILFPHTPPTAATPTSTLTLQPSANPWNLIQRPCTVYSIPDLLQYHQKIRRLR